MAHYVFDHELRTLGSTTTGAPLTFFGLSLGAAITCGGVLTQHLSTNAHASFVALFVAALALTLFFFIWSVVAAIRRHSVISDIKGRPVEGPVGGEGVTSISS
jgi:hypothetical protein